jgi:DNA (cytosine-5)-methyltransferase 1
MEDAMRYLSVCSGIEAATQAWHPMGWQPVAFSEIDPFPRAVLAHHFPHVPNHGDMTRFQEWPDHAIDLLCGGTPCQSFSVAGLRKGLDDPRGNLMLTFGAIAGRYRPRWLVWENVPGVLSSNGGRDFGAFLGMLGQLGYGFAYRVLDAQHVRTCRFPRAVPQRRRRVFVVGYLGDWRRAASVLFDRESLSGHPAPGRKARQEVAGNAAERIGRSMCANSGDVGYCLTASAQQSLDAETETLIAFGWQNSASQGDSVSACVTPTLDKSKTPAVSQNSAVRRLTPRECERLQGFPDDWTRIPYRGKSADLCPDWPRYKAIGNSWAVNCAEWIGERIAEVDTWETT